MSGEMINYAPINLKKTAKQNVFALINKTNPIHIAIDQITLGDPAVWIPSGDDPRNTEVIATAAPDTGWEGSVPVQYRRIDIAELGTGLEFPYDNGISFAQNLKKTAATLKLLATDVQFGTATLPSPLPGDDFVALELQAIANSYLYIGATQIVFTGIAKQNTRILEDGTVRRMEDGTARSLETA